MTKQEIAKAFINLFYIAENDRIAFGDEDPVATVCEDAGITKAQWNKIVDIAYKED